MLKELIKRPLRGLPLSHAVSLRSGLPAIKWVKACDCYEAVVACRPVEPSQDYCRGKRTTIGACIRAPGRYTSVGVGR